MNCEHGISPVYVGAAGWKNQSLLGLVLTEIINRRIAAICSEFGNGAGVGAGTEDENCARFGVWRGHVKVLRETGGPDGKRSGHSRTRNIAHKVRGRNKKRKNDRLTCPLPFSFLARTAGVNHSRSPRKEETEDSWRKPGYGPLPFHRLKACAPNKDPAYSASASTTRKNPVGEVAGTATGTEVSPSASAVQRRRTVHSPPRTGVHWTS